MNRESPRPAESPARPLRGARRAERAVRELLGEVGIEVGGRTPGDLQVRDPRFYARVLRDGALGLGESYMDRQWDCDALDQFFDRLLRGRLDLRFRSRASAALAALSVRLLNPQRVRRSYEVGRRHYDIGNDLYEAMLDSRLVYSCAYWRHAEDLESAQTDKLELICRKLALKPGMRLLDIGCGWGGLAQYAAQTRGVHVVGVTVSREQAQHAERRCAGLPVQIRFQDYRSVCEPFDAVVSIGMLEHVGPRNYGTFMRIVSRCLAGRGAALLQSVTGNRSTLRGDPWLNRYVFPNSSLPSPAQLTRAMEERFSLEDVHGFGPDYDRTLCAWHARFERAWPELRSRYDERFRRMWRYYLLMSAGAFRARYTQLHQIVATPIGAPPPARQS